MTLNLSGCLSINLTNKIFKKDISPKIINSKKNKNENNS